MTVREETQRLESEMLAPWAARSAQTRGRSRPEEECQLRTPYQRDRDRVIHCKSFRRLKHKTQVFLSPRGGTTTAPASPTPWRCPRSPGPSPGPCASTRT